MARDRESGCHTDITRTLVVGEPPAKLLELHELCSQALDLVLKEIRPGAGTGKLHEVACRFFETKGYRTPLSLERGEILEDGAPFALGHGVGLEVHEAPVLRSGETSALVAGDVLAIEPGLYIAGFGGCRIEEIVLVTEAGGEPISRHERRLEIT